MELGAGSAGIANMKSLLGLSLVSLSFTLALPVMAQTAQPCASLAGASIPAGAIGLPTTGASVTSAADTSTVNGAFCKVLGAIHPVDAKAPDILFQLNLPANWNGKALQMGGGGYNGRLVTGEDGRFPDPKKPLPLGQGYATFGSDSGHETKPGEDAAGFAANPEALRNFGGDQIKKTHDVAVFLINSITARRLTACIFRATAKAAMKASRPCNAIPPIMTA